MRYRPTDRVAVIATDDRVVLGVLPDGPILVLEDTAAAVWDAVVAMPVEDAIVHLGDRYGVAAQEIEPHLHRICGELLEAGVLMNDPDAQRRGRAAQG